MTAGFVWFGAYANQVGIGPVILLRILLFPKQAYSDSLDERWRSDYFGAVGRRQPGMPQK
jgi:hypothetical protein